MVVPYTRVYNSNNGIALEPTDTEGDRKFPGKEGQQRKDSNKSRAEIDSFDKALLKNAETMLTMNWQEEHID